MRGYPLHLLRDVCNGRCPIVSTGECSLSTSPLDARVWHFSALHASPRPCLIREASSTGVDPSHPPGAAVDGVLASFWLSTGLFPQTLTIRLQKPVAVYEVISSG